LNTNIQSKVSKMSNHFILEIINAYTLKRIMNSSRTGRTAWTPVMQKTSTLDGDPHENK